MKGAEVHDSRQVFLLRDKETEGTTASTRPEASETTPSQEKGEEQNPLDEASDPGASS